jgi:hypothetical protein
MHSASSQSGELIHKTYFRKKLIESKNLVGDIFAAIFCGLNNQL